MISDLKKYPLHYLLLGLVLTIHGGVAVFFQHDTLIVEFILVSSGVSFFCWSVIHHYLIKDLTREIVTEYLLFSLLAMLLLRALVIY